MDETNDYDVSDVAKLTAAFTEVESEAPVDPTTLVLKIVDPAGTVTTWTYGIGIEIVRVSQGVYFFLLLLTVSGTYYYRWEGTGAAQAAGQNSLYVRKAVA